MYALYAFKLSLILSNAPISGAFFYEKISLKKLLQYSAFCGNISYRTLYERHIMNISTLAKLCGVSPATVSKAFSGNDEISEDTKNKIFETAKKNGCYDKYNKNKYDKKVIAVICPELNSNYYNKYVTLLDREITALGGIMTVSVSNFDARREELLFSYYTSYCRADGIITINQLCQPSNDISIPTVAVMPSEKLTLKDKITSVPALDSAIEYLKNNGHTEIGFVGEPLTLSKCGAFKDSLRRFLLPVNEKYIKNSNLRFEEAGISAMDSWFEENSPLPTAIVAAYDYIALGVIKSIRRHGLSVPEDISVIGMDDITVGSYLEKPLSTIKSNVEIQCRKAAEIIMKKIKNSLYTESVSVPAEFMPKETSGKAPECRPDAK